MGLGYAGGRLGRSGPSACSAAQCLTTPHPHAERRYLLIPSVRSSLSYMAGTEPGPRRPRIARAFQIEPAIAKGGYRSVHTAHCHPDAIYTKPIGAPDGDGRGGSFLLGRHNHWSQPRFGKKYMLSLNTILEPLASGVTRRMRSRNLPPQRDAIPVITKRGRTLTVRPLTAGDAPLVADLLAGLSERSRQLRFFQPLRSGEAILREAARVANADPRLHAALAATQVDDGVERVVAVAELAHDQGVPAAAEIALVVRDDYQHEGIGRMLAIMLVQLGRLRGVKMLHATMLAENQAMRKLVYGLGIPYTAHTYRGEIDVVLRLPHEI